MGEIKGGDMGSQFLRIQWCSLFLLTLFAISCTLNLELKKPKGEGEFSRETSRLEKLAREDPAKSVRAKSCLQLAFLYVNYRNPQLNYSRALQAMEGYLSMSPTKAQKDDIQNWLAVLKEVDRVRKGKKGMEAENLEFHTRIRKLRTSLETENLELHTQIRKLRISLEKAQETNRKVRDTVASLQETIEKLKDLDYRMEEKRDLVK
jgi:hypothetical protein